MARTNGTLARMAPLAYLAVGGLLTFLGIAIGRNLGATERTPHAPIESGATLDSLERRLDRLAAELGRRLDGLSLGPPAPDPSELTAARTDGERAPVPDGAPTAGPADLAPLLERLSAIEASLAALPESFASAGAVVRIPTSELLQSASPEPLWDALIPIQVELDAGGTRKQEAVERLRWTSQAEALRNFGRPSSISEDGIWVYLNPEGGHLVLNFTGDWISGAYARR